MRTSMIRNRNRTRRARRGVGCRPGVAGAVPVGQRVVGHLLEALESRCLLNGVGPQGPEFPVNADPTGTNTEPCVAMNDAGNFVVAWTSYNAQDHTAGIDAQRYDRLGVPQGGEFRVVTLPQGEFYGDAMPDAAMDDYGNFMITWFGYERDGPAGIYARRYNASGAALGDQFQVNTSAGGQRSPAVATSRYGAFVIAWQAQDGDGLGIYAQRYNSSGQPAGGEFRVNTATSGSQADATLAMDRWGNFVVSWKGPGGVYAQRYDSSGAPQGGEFQVSTTGEEPDAAMDDAGNFVVSWWAFDGDIYAKRYDTTGVAHGGEFRVNTTTEGQWYSPSATMDDQGNFVIAWERGFEIAARRYDASGVAQGDEFQVNTTTDGIQLFPAVAMAGAGNFVVAWGSTNLGFSNIYAQRYGNPVGAPEFGDMPLMSVSEATNGVHDTWGAFRPVTIAVTDPDTPEAGLTYSTDWGYFSNWPVPHSLWLPTFEDGPSPAHTVHIRVTDDTGLSDTATIQFQVSNVAPQLYRHIGPLAVPNQNPLPGQPAVLPVDIADSLFDDLEVWWDFGDGVVTSPVPVTQSWWGTNVSFNFASATHQYERTGSYTATCFVRDDDGAVSTLQFPVTYAQYAVDPQGVLRVGGTSGNDVIHVSPGPGGKTNLFLNGGYQGAFAANAVIASGFDGEDTLDAASDLAVPVTFYGGAGNDLLRGGAADDLLLGEGGNDGLDARAGNDVLVGGSGNDIAFAGAGNDILIGGLGSDSLYGEAGDDALISGSTTRDEDIVQLGTAIGAWNASSGYDVRTAAMRATFQTGLQDGTSDVDWLWGGTYGIPDRDYFMSSSPRSLFADRLLNEAIN